MAVAAAEASMNVTAIATQLDFTARIVDGLYPVGNAGAVLPHRDGRQRAAVLQLPQDLQPAQVVHGAFIPRTIGFSG